MKWNLRQRTNGSWRSPSHGQWIVQADEELGTIVAIIGELGDWLQEQYGAAKDFAKQQADKFKKKIEKFKGLNGRTEPLRDR